MEYTYLGESDIEVSRIALGLWNIVDDTNWDGADEQEAIDAIHTAVDEGITFLDTAEAYGDGYSEERLGRALKTIDRSEVTIASKVKDENLGYKDLKAACEASLERLGLDTIDVYYLHWPNQDIPFEESARALLELKEEGKIRASAVSNFGPVDLDGIVDEIEVAANQLPYNLLWRAIEYEITDVCRENDVDIVCYSPLAQGMLAGAFDSPAEVPPGRARTRHFSSDRPEARHNDEGAEKETFEAIDRFETICDEYDVGYAQGALSWLLNRDDIASVIVGATSPDHVRANAQVPELDLPVSFYEELNESTAGLKDTLGSNPDLWQSDSRYH